MSTVRPFGRGLRLIVGGVLLVQVLLLLRGLPWQTSGLAIGAATALAAVYAGIHFGITRLELRSGRWVGAILLLAPLVAMYGLGGVPGRLGTLIFLGVSLIIAGARADPGCEVLSVPALLTRRRTYMPCVFFTPFDWLENRLTRGNREVEGSKRDNERGGGERRL